MEKNLVFKVSGLPGRAGEAQIIRGLGNLDGIKNVTASATEGTVSIENEGCDESLIINKIESMGFHVE